MTKINRDKTKKKALAPLLDLPQSQIPVWLMRQAGRYLPEYRKIRQKNTFIDMLQNPNIVHEVTLQPIHRFQLDAAILFSDILVILEPLGYQVSVKEKVGPIITPTKNTVAPNTLLSPEQVTSKLNYVFESIKLLKKSCNTLNIPLIGFAGGPFTTTSYLIEGGSSKTLVKTKQMLHQSPNLFHSYLKQVQIATEHYLEEQVNAGVDMIQIFDTWLNNLSWHEAKTYLEKTITPIVKKINQKVPVIFFCKNSSLLAPLIAKTGAHGISIDTPGHLGNIQKSLPKTITLQGNLDPTILLGSKTLIKKETEQILNTIPNKQKYIFNLGHGILPQTKPENVSYLLEIIKNHPL